MWSEVDKDYLGVCGQKVSVGDEIKGRQSVYRGFSLKAELANSTRLAGQVAQGILFPIHQHWDYRCEAQLNIYMDTDIHSQALVGSIIPTVVV